MQIVLSDNLGPVRHAHRRGGDHVRLISFVTVLAATAFAAALLYELARLDLAGRRPQAAARAARVAPAGVLAPTLLAIAALISRHALQDSASRDRAGAGLLGALAVVIAPRAGAAGAVVLYSVTIGAAGALLYAKSACRCRPTTRTTSSTGTCFGEGFSRPRSRSP